MHENILILGIVLVVLSYGFYSNLLNRWNVTGPMIFTIVGILFSPLFLGEKLLHLEGEIVQTLAEIALIVVLFADASTLHFDRLKRFWRIPARMLGIALPLTILFAAGVGLWCFPDQPPLYVVLLSLLLAPTDAALGKAVVTDPIVPEQIRNSINVESGLNDGFVFPILITVTALLSSGQDHAQGYGWLFNVLEQIFLGTVGGIFVGYTGALQSRFSLKKGWLAESYRDLIPFALAIFAYYFSEYIGGNGYIGAFVAGMVFGNLTPALTKHVEAFVESEGELLILIIFTLFGLVFVPALIHTWNVKVLCYALLSLTLFRMLPVVLSLTGLGLDGRTKLFLAWFGPRGIASILYLIIVAHQLGGIEGHETIYGTVTLTIFLSIFFHGLSAKPLAQLYTRQIGRKT